tara:strand:- start:56 stop:328 length:273 start_codon:yes stop_codon:yes gene_type:complete
MEELKDLLRRKYVIDKDIETNMYVDCGPSDEDFMEASELAKLIEAKEKEMILIHYRKLTGKLLDELNDWATHYGEVETQSQEDTNAKQES